LTGIWLSVCGASEAESVVDSVVLLDAVVAELVADELLLSEVLDVFAEASEADVVLDTAAAVGAVAEAFVSVVLQPMVVNVMFPFASTHLVMPPALAAVEARIKNPKANLTNVVMNILFLHLS
jgi:hypothetical protein